MWLSEKGVTIDDNVLIWHNESLPGPTDATALSEGISFN